MASRDRYKQTNDLFVRGMVVTVTPDGPPIWVQKLNAFEIDDARTHASTRRSLSVRALREVGSDEKLALQQAADGMDKAALIDGIVNWRYSRHLAAAAGAVDVDPTWAESQAILDRSGDLGALEPEERELVARLNAEYYERVRAGVEQRNDEARAELDSKDVPGLRDQFVDAFVEHRGNAVFTREHRVAEIATGIRMCDATPDDLGSYADADHAACKHLPLYVAQPMLDSEGQPVLVDGEPVITTAYEQVRALSDELYAVYSRAFDEVNVKRSVAKDSASRQSSSASSRPQNEAEGSTPSTPTAAQPVAVGT